MVVKVKKMSESSYAKLVKEVNAVGEQIRVYQDEKQDVINDFEKEKKRYKSGKISEKTLSSSVRKTKNEIKKLDGKLKDRIKKIAEISNKMKEFTASQKPMQVNVKLTGVTKKIKRRKPVKKKKRK